MKKPDSFHSMLYHLIIGLRNWRKDPTDIPVELKKGHLLLAKLCLEAQSDAPSDIPTLVQWITKPLKEWHISLPNVITFPLDAPIYIRNIGLSPEAADFLNDYQSPQEADQREVFQILEYCRNAEHPMSELYRTIRVFLSNSNNAIITGAKLSLFARSLNDRVLAERVYDCYEEISNRTSHFRKCKRCGWTLVWNGSNWQCGPEDLCGKIITQGDPELIDNSRESVFRLKEGVHRYTLIPGLAEAGLEKRLVKKGYLVDMYPEVDRYDLAVRKQEGTYYFDLKDYKSPYSLAFYFNQLPLSVLEKYEADRVYIVVPMYRNKLTRGYIKQVEKLLDARQRSVLRFINEKDVVNVLGGEPT